MLHLFFTLTFLCTVVVDSAVLNRKYDVIVVGLGASGATAASTLARAGKKVLALEAQSYIGGRVQTVPFADGLVELGAEWIHGTEGSFTYDTASNASIEILIQDDTSLSFFSNGSFAEHELVTDVLGYLDPKDIAEDPPQPMGEYITARVNTYLKENYPHVLEDPAYLNNLLDFMNSCECFLDGSNDWNDVSTASKYEQLDGSQDASWHKIGYETFFDILLDTYNNGSGISNLDIKLNSEVTRISYFDEGPSGLVQVTTREGVTYDAESVIVTVSLGVLQERHESLFHPSLPENKTIAIEKMSIGTIDKIILYFEEIWWPRDITAFEYIWQEEERNKISEDDKWVLKLFISSISMGSENALVFWIYGDAAKKMESLTDDVVKSKVMEVTRMFMGGNQTILDPISMIRTSWYSNPFTRGSYTYDNILTPQYPDARNILAEPISDANGVFRILFAGEATSANHYSTVHGAAETGEREAMRLLEGK